MNTTELRSLLGSPIQVALRRHWLDWYPVVGPAGTVVDAVPADDPSSGAAAGYTYDANEGVYRAAHDTPNPVVLRRFREEEL